MQEQYIEHSYIIFTLNLHMFRPVLIYHQVKHFLQWLYICIIYVLPTGYAVPQLVEALR
jgi:hypothetical protein